MKAEMSYFETGPSWIVWRGGGETVRVESWGANSVRVRATMAAEVIDTDYALLGQPDSTVKVSVHGAAAELINGQITAVLTASESYDAQAGYTVSSCEIEFRDARGAVLLKEHRAGGALKLRARAYRAILGGPHQILSLIHI